MAPSPLPGEPAVEIAVGQAAADVGHPRPPVQGQDLHAADAPPASSARRTSSPPPACLTRFVAASVTTMATRPAPVSSKPSRPASRRGDPPGLADLARVVDREDDRLARGVITSTS